MVVSMTLYRRWKRDTPCASIPSPASDGPGFANPDDHPDNSGRTGNLRVSSVQFDPSAMPPPHVHCEALVRTADRDRYLAGLFAPAAVRWHLYALYAFAGEIARVREAARGPLPGEIRLQWWRDVLAGEGRGEVSAHPVAAALLDTVARCALPKERLIALIDAHGFDLYDDAMPGLADLDAYAAQTAGTLFGLGARILGGTDAAAIAAARRHRRGHRGAPQHRRPARRPCCAAPPCGRGIRTLPGGGTRGSAGRRAGLSGGHAGAVLAGKARCGGGRPVRAGRGAAMAPPVGAVAGGAKVAGGVKGIEGPAAATTRTGPACCAARSKSAPRSRVRRRT